MRLDDWNDRYRAREELVSDPSPLLIDAAALIAPGRALDLACGAGRNAIWLARNGWNVTAVDGAPEALRIVQELEPKIDVQTLDLETTPLPFPDDFFDLVAILYFLHRPLFAEAQRVVRRGGIFVTAVRTSGINPQFCVREGELRSFFHGWEILRDEEDNVAELIALKPNQQPSTRQLTTDN